MPTNHRDCVGLPVCSKSGLLPLQLLALSERDPLPEVTWEGPFEALNNSISALGQTSFQVEQSSSV